MRRSSSRTAAAIPTNRFSRPLDCFSRPSADLAGRSVAISPNVPPEFDGPLAGHHKLIGHWVALREDGGKLFARPEARRHIERVFGETVLQVLEGFDLVDLRVGVLNAVDGYPPALAVTCDSIGQLDLGWIEKSNVLANTLFDTVAPVSWRAAAYHTIASTLGAAIPVITYEDLFEEVSAYYWDGETDDEGARASLMQWHDYDPADIDEMTLPSTMNASRPDWMLAANAAPLKDMPAALSQRIRAVRAAHKALKGLAPDANAWRFDCDTIVEYAPDIMDRSTLPPITIVSFDHFQRELDDVARHGMEQGFADIIGICPLTAAGRIDDWFASLKIGAALLRAIQDLIDFDPADREARHV